MDPTASRIASCSIGDLPSGRYDLPLPLSIPALFYSVLFSSGLAWPVRRGASCVPGSLSHIQTASTVVVGGAGRVDGYATKRRGI